MSADPLYQPLGLAPATPPRRAGGRVIWVAPALIVLVGAGAAGLLVHRGTGRADVAVAVAPIEVAAATAPRPPAVPASPASAGPGITDLGDTAAAGPSGGTTVEVQNGVKIVRFAPSASSASVAIPVGDAKALKPAPDSRVSETTRWGPLPRIGSGGLRPADVYGRPASLGAGPAIAVLLDGMGADQAATANAARRLPGAVSFAFGPEVADVAAQVAETRRAGHEVFLQLAAAAPDTAPASTGQPDAPAAGSLDVLHRSMAKVAGYAGVVFDGEASADSPALLDVAARGLALVAALKGDTDERGAMPPDIVIDGGAGHTAVTAAFARLGAIAREKGHALIRVGHAGPVVDDIAALAGRLQAEGVALAPVTALTARLAVAATK